MSKIPGLATNIELFLKELNANQLLHATANMPYIFNDTKYDNEYKVALKVFPSTVKNKDGKATIGDIKIVYDSNHRINSTPDQVDYYLLELARYLKWLTTNDKPNGNVTINDFLKSEQKSISFIKNIPVESENKTNPPVAGGSRIRRTKRRCARKNVTKKRK